MNREGPGILDGRLLAREGPLERRRSGSYAGISGHAGLGVTYGPMHRQEPKCLIACDWGMMAGIGATAAAAD